MTTIEDAKKYVGGHFEDAGFRQFTFMVKEGLRPDSKLLEVGCGCLRAGLYFIGYLNPGNYVGIEHHQWLIDEARKDENINPVDKRGQRMFDVQLPFFIVNDNFDLTGLNTQFDFMLAKSLFTHLTKDKIKQCYDNLRPHLKDSGVFYTSIFNGDSSKNLKKSDDTRKFSYSLEEIKELADSWQIESIGHQGCFYQTMLKCVKI
jgi:cyclopropane fatty-acyl-phospholipid synthase-like methyltransferase